MHPLRRRAGVSVRRLPAALAALLVGAGCDRVEPAGAPPPSPTSSSPTPRAAARPMLEAVMSASTMVVGTCRAGKLRLRHDDADLWLSSSPVDPCVLEVCSPSVGDLDTLRKATAAARDRLVSDPMTAPPSIAGFVAMAEQMIRYVDTAAEAKFEGMGGLSMHHGVLARTFLELYPDAQVAIEPPPSWNRSRCSRSGGIRARIRGRSTSSAGTFASR